MPTLVATGQITIQDVMDGLYARLSNAAATVPADTDGSNADLTGCVTTMSIFLGGLDVSAEWTVTAQPSNGVTGSLAGKTYTVTGITSDSGYVDLIASKPGQVDITARFTIAKARRGYSGPAIDVVASRAGISFVDNFMNPPLQDIGFTLIRNNAADKAGWYATDNVTPVTDDGMLTALGAAFGGVTGIGDNCYLHITDFGADNQVALTCIVGSLVHVKVIPRLDRATAEPFADVTGNNTAAAIVGQSDWATYYTINPFTMANKTQHLDNTTGFLTDLDRITSRPITRLKRADNATDVTEAAVVTGLGTAAAIAGQGPGATATAAEVLNYRDEGSTGFVAKPEGGTLNLGGANQSGILKIALPQGWTNTMLRFRLEVFDYASGGVQTFEIGGYTYPGSGAGGEWVNQFANFIGPRSRSLPVRFGHDGAKCCVWVGETTTVWQYTKFQISSLVTGHSFWNASSWRSGWAMSLSTSAATNVGGNGNLKETLVPRAGDAVFGESVQETAGGTVATLAAFKTASGTAAAFVGQSSWATYSGLTPTNVAGQVSALDTGGNLSSLNKVSNRRMTLLKRDDGVSDLTEAAAITSLGTAAAISGQGYLATQNFALASRLLVAGYDNIIPDSDYRDSNWWGFQSLPNVSFQTADNFWEQERQIQFVCDRDFDFSSTYFAVEPGSVYRVRVRIWNNGSTWTGAFWPLIHMPGVAWWSLKHGTSVNDTVADANNAIVALGDPGVQEFYFRATANTMKKIQFRFKSTARGSNVLFQVQISKVPQLGKDLIKPGTATKYTTAEVETGLGTAAAIVGQGAGATANNLAQLDATAASQLAALANVSKQTAAYGETIKRRLAAGDAVALDAIVNCNSGGVSGSIRARIDARPYGGSWSAVATGAGSSTGPGEPGGDSVVGTFTNSTGIEQLFEFRVMDQRTPSGAGGTIIYPQSYVAG